MLKAEKTYNATAAERNAWSRLFPIPESIYPFTKEEIIKFNDKSIQNKPTWVYQQLLKLYSYRALGSHNVPLRRHFLSIDSDTVLLKPLVMQEDAEAEAADWEDEGIEEGVGGAGERDTRRRWFVSIASSSSGPFESDLISGTRLMKELFDSAVPKAFPDYGGERFTAITHHMLFDGELLEEMLRAFETRYRLPAWQTLSTLRKSSLSEFELYLAFVMHGYREHIAVRQLPYVNWGRCDQDSIRVATSKDVVYLTSHDDWDELMICCVNSVWLEISNAAVGCPCCTTIPEPTRTALGLGPFPKCRHRRIDCSTIGIEGCRERQTAGVGPYLIFPSHPKNMNGTTVDFSGAMVARPRIDPKYPKCFVENPDWIGDGFCNGPNYNTTQCEYSSRPTVEKRLLYDVNLNFIQ